MKNGLLPIGSVVLLKNGTKRVMIIGVCQMETGEEKKLWDYVGCAYPEGFIGGNRNFLFNEDQVERLYAIGYQDEEQFAFRLQAEATLKKLREAQA